MNFNMKKLNQFKNSNFKLDKWHTGSQSNDFRTVKESFFVKGISISLGATIVCLENFVFQTCRAGVEIRFLVWLLWAGELNSDVKYNNVQSK